MKVVQIKTKTTENTCDAALQAAMGDLESVLVVGWDKDGNMVSVASDNMTSKPEIIYLLESLKFEVLSGAMDEEIQE